MPIWSLRGPQHNEAISSGENRAENGDKGGERTSTNDAF